MDSNSSSWDVDNRTAHETVTHTESGSRLAGGARFREDDGREPDPLDPRGLAKGGRPGRR